MQDQQVGGSVEDVLEISGVVFVDAEETEVRFGEYHLIVVQDQLVAPKNPQEKEIKANKQQTPYKP